VVGLGGGVASQVVETKLLKDEIKMAGESLGARGDALCTSFTAVRRRPVCV
jgi:hypothetical protein